jgi:hypothetical protein
MPYQRMRGDELVIQLVRERQSKQVFGMEKGGDPEHNVHMQRPTRYSLGALYSFLGLGLVTLILHLKLLVFFGMLPD